MQVFLFLGFFLFIFVGVDVIANLLHLTFSNIDNPLFLFVNFLFLHLSFLFLFCNVYNNNCQNNL